MNTKKDYYKILAVAFNASDDDIKVAYRKAAQDHHPDKYSGNNATIKKQLKEMFQDINEAYEVLSKNRAAYDKSYNSLQVLSVDDEKPPVNGTAREDFLYIFKIMYITAKNDEPWPEWFDDVLMNFGSRHKGTFEQTLMLAFFRHMETQGDDISQLIQAYKKDSITYHLYGEKLYSLGYTEFANVLAEGEEGAQNAVKAPAQSREKDDAERKEQIEKGVGIISGIFGFVFAILKPILNTIDGSDD